MNTTAPRCFARTPRLKPLCLPDSPQRSDAAKKYVVSSTVSTRALGPAGVRLGGLAMRYEPGKSPKTYRVCSMFLKPPARQMTVVLNCEIFHRPSICIKVTSITPPGDKEVIDVASSQSRLSRLALRTRLRRPRVSLTAVIASQEFIGQRDDDARRAPHVAESVPVLVLNISPTSSAPWASRRATVLSPQLFMPAAGRALPNREPEKRGRPSSRPLTARRPV